MNFKKFATFVGTVVLMNTALEVVIEGLRSLHKKAEKAKKQRSSQY